VSVAARPVTEAKAGGTAPRSPPPAPRTSGAPGSAPFNGQHQNHFWPIAWGVLVASLIVWGANARLERYITPQRGIGYWLGIVGGSLMLLLLVYSARKRAAWLRWIGTIPAWFQLHMVLGVVGPLLVLFHANFRLGATNSNVALICMLLVAGSGVVGRYIYTRVHAHMDGNEDTLEELRAVAVKIRAQTTSIAFLPGLLDAIEAEERRLVEPAATAFGRLAQFFTAAARSMLGRWRLHRMVRRAVARAVRDESESIARHARRISMVARGYADRRLDAARRVAEYRLYARLFSLWHVLHIPLFFMLLIAGIVHVIAVNVY
jgi:hypothetical protein